MASLISLQGESGGDAVAARAQSLFGASDANGDGQISKSEFETAFGSNANTSKVDGLFSALDGNGDGSVSQDELTSAAQQSHANAITTTITGCRAPGRAGVGSRSFVVARSERRLSADGFRR